MPKYMVMTHVLRDLNLPDRYEKLVEVLGHEVARVLTKVSQVTLDALESASLAVDTRGEGLFIPIYAPSGAGKTTFANNLNTFFLDTYAKPVQYPDRVREISYQNLNELIEGSSARELGDNKILPIVIDHRESDPPSDQEISEIKRFLRVARVKCLVIWLTTNHDIAVRMAKRIIEISGTTPFDIPIIFEGPEKNEWQDIALNTMVTANSIQDIAQLGVNPKEMPVDGFKTVGEYIRNISTEFNKNKLRLLRETRKPISLIIAFATKSQDPGIISSLTNGNRYGMLEGQALLQSSPDSEVGRWWKARVSLLTRTILVLNAKLTYIGPTASINALRNYSNDQLTLDKLSSMNIDKKNPSGIYRDLSRTDFYKHVTSAEIGAFENRGTPPEKSAAAFDLIASDRGFTYGKDKTFNKAVADSLEEAFKIGKFEYISIKVEKNIDDALPIIPDTTIETSSAYICIEYTWRKGEFLTKSNRSAISQYVLEKLRVYARELKWTND